MIKIRIFLPVITSIILSLNLIASANNEIKKVDKKLNIYFIGSSTCGECLEIKEIFLKPAVAKNTPKLNLVIYDLI